MKLPIYLIDAFTSERFKGNPAAVVPLDQWLPVETMQAIAAENNLSETAFFIREAGGGYHIRWFSPLKEIDFCGHATLASAFVLFRNLLTASPVTFRAAAVGELPVLLREDGMIEMSFPEREPGPVPDIPEALLAGLSIRPKEVLKNVQAYVAVYADEDQVRAIVPDPQRLIELGPLDVAVTAPGKTCDFVSRYFWPANGGVEDPVTGSIHAGLAPFWGRRLHKTSLVALQASRRSGILACRLDDCRVHVAGAAVQYLEGSIEI
ncbi:MAG: PhzF family phenazine biosynthesis protein [Desulfobulbaceae bacterium]|nr:MAG: PhzF family phenazine biosynthesis protein [Desulfobulbaceae bacterium]